MTIRELPTVEEFVFDEFATHPLASFLWGSIRAKTGLKVVRFGVFDGDELVQTYQMTLHRIPVLKYWIGYVPRSAMPSDSFLEYLKVYCKKYKIIFVMFEPDVIAGMECAHIPPRGAARDQQAKRRAMCPREDHGHIPSLLRVSATPLFYRFSRVIDLTKPLDVLKSELDATTRYNVGLAQRKGVTVSVDDTDQGFEDFYLMYESTTKRQRFGGHTRKYHQTIWDVFSKKGIAHILVARHGGQPLAACELWLYKNILYYTYAGSSIEKRNLKAMNALMWNVIQYGKEHGATKLDLWGILPPNSTDPNDPWAGFSDFKKGFGGEVIEMVGSYDLVVFPALYFAYQIAYNVRAFLQKFKLTF